MSPGISSQWGILGSSGLMAEDSGIQLGSESQRKLDYTENPIIKKWSIMVATKEQAEKPWKLMFPTAYPHTPHVDIPSA